MTEEVKKTKNDFSKGPVWRAIVRMAVPMMLAQLVNVLYSVVDRMYIGHMEGVGALALTGLGLCMPMISLIAAFASLCGMNGGAPLCSIARGEGDLDRAERIMGNAFALLLALGVVLMALCLVWLKPIVYLVGGSDATWPFARDYARIYLLGTLFVMISLGMNAFINAQGFARIGMLTVVLGAVVNIVLDPIFIFAFRLGIAGAAIATVIAQGCSAAWCLAFLLGKHAILKLRLRCMRPDARILGRIVGLGVTGFIMGATNSVVQIAYNTQLQLHGGDLFVGAMTVINSIREILFMCIFGLTSGSQPVLGFNYGARAYERVRAGIRFVGISAVIYTAVATLVLTLFPRALASVFTSDAALREICAPTIRIYFCGFVLMSLQLTGQSTFVALGKSRQAVIFSLLRKVVIVVPLIYLLPLVPGMGVYGVFWSEPISDLLGASTCFLTMYLTVYRRLGKGSTDSL